MDERQIPDYPDYIARSDGTIYNTKHKRIVKSNAIGIIRLYDDQGRSKQLTFAHAILEAFGRRRPFPTCKLCYRDKNPANLAPDNLYWAVGTAIRCGQCKRPMNVKNNKEAGKLHPTLCWGCCGLTIRGSVPGAQKTWPCPLCAEVSKQSAIIGENHE